MAAAFAGQQQRWQRELPRHPIFNKLRVNHAASEPCSAGDEGSRGGTRDLMFSLNGDLFIWDDTICAFYTADLRQLNLEEEEEGGVRTHRHQTLLCIDPPRFRVRQVLLSPTQHYVALVGRRGATVLELPRRRQGSRSEFEDGRAEVNCKTVPVAECFTAGPAASSVSLWQAAWYPSETEEPHLALLVSDNTVRFYSLKSPRFPAKVLRLSQSDEDGGGGGGVRTKCSYAASLGETAVAFDFGPASRPAGRQRSKDMLVHPLYVLYGNGETYLSYANLARGTMNLSRPAGPLPMYPADENNYGSDACAVLCLPCVPNVLVIATESGTLYHCVVLEVDEDEPVEWQTARCFQAAAAAPSLYVFECLELELTLKLASAGVDEDYSQEEVSHFTCPVRLHRDPLHLHGYHCTHEAGVHSVGLAWFDRLRVFLRSAEEEDEDGLRELSAAVVEHVLCTRPLGSTPPAPVRGFSVVSDLSLGATMVCVTGAYECLLLPLMLSSVRPPSPPLLCSRSDAAAAPPRPGPARDGSTTEQHVRDILARGSSNPLVLKAGGGDDKDTTSSPPRPAECLQLLGRATQVFREEYVLKQDAAREALQRRAGLLTAQSDKQREDVALCAEDRESLGEEAERLADKYRDGKGRQEAIAGRVRQLLVRLHRRLPVLSDGDREMRRELQVTAEKLSLLDGGVKQLHAKMEYRRRRADASAATTAAAKTVLDAQERKIVRDYLRKQGEQIADMMKHIKDVKEHISF